jgi:hypothetical protein
MLFGNAFAQNSPARFSAEVNAGVPVLFASIPSSLSTYAGAGIRYNITRAVSVQLSLNGGFMHGAQPAKHPLVTEDIADNYIKYSNTFAEYTLRSQISLKPLIGYDVQPLRRINPFVTIGAGYTWAPSIRSEKIDGRIRNYDRNTFWTTQYGVAVRYYLNHSVDLNAGMEFNVTQTNFLDGIPMDGQMDHYLTTYVGVSYKIASRFRGHIEWDGSHVSKWKKRHRKLFGKRR